MRVLFVSHSFAPEGAPLANVGGMQRVAMELHAELQRRPDVEVDTLVLRAPWKGIYFRAVPFLASLIARLPVRTRRRPPDVILFSSITNALPVAAVAKDLRRRGIRIASIAHGLDVTMPHPAYQAVVKRTLAQLDVVLPVSAATGEECKKRGARRVEVVPNGVDLDRFAGPRGELPSELPDDALLLVSVGRQVKRKGFAWFVREVMPRLPEHVRYWLAGHGPEHEDIEASIRAEGLEDRVQLLGMVPEETLRALLARADLFVMPNVVVEGDMEGFGIVMIEAAACGVPTVAADLEGIRDVIRHEQTGWREPSHNADAFVRRIEGLDRETLARVGEAAKERVRDELGWAAVAQRYLDVLRTL